MPVRRSRPWYGLVAMSILGSGPVPAASLSAIQVATPLLVDVRHNDAPVAAAIVSVGGATYVTGPDGSVSIPGTPGTVEIRVTKDGFLPSAATVVVTDGAPARVVITLTGRPSLEEEVVVVASTRTGKRLEDQPMRVEVVPSDEVQEKIMMTPGDVSMLLAETNGLRLQTTSPSLGGASVRVQGLRGRYTQLLSDGLPLFGGTGSIGLLQIPPMDLGQVEVIKGVASALYGMSAVGGVINLVSRRPPDEGHEAELLVNANSHAGADIVNWLAGPIDDAWGYTFVGGIHTQNRSDLDRDGWTDLPRYRRVVARPRLFWNDGAGRSLLATVGVMREDRSGGTWPGRTAPDGAPFAEGLNTRRLDGGLVAQVVTAGGRVAAARASISTQRHAHAFGPVAERDHHGAALVEATLTGATGDHTWVVGAAMARDTYTSDDVPRFNYSYTVPGVFVQNDFAPAETFTISGSARIDAHSEFGTFVSPRLSVLFRPHEEWSLRVSGGRGHSAPTPFIEGTDAVGLTPLAPTGRLEAERASSISADLTWTPAPFEITATAFRSRIDGALALRATPGSAFPVELAPVDGPVSTWGTEVIARIHREDFDIVATHMFLASTESDAVGSGRRPVPLNPTHTASFDLLKQVGPARIGFEVFFTGRQPLEDNPFRERGFAHVLFGGLVDWAIGPARVFVNIENIADVRQTREHPLVLPARAADGRWTVDAWAPIEGRTVNAGLRFAF